MAKIAVVFYSTYLHTYKLAQQVEAGLKAAGAQVDLFQIPETLSEDVLKALHAAPKPEIPFIDDVNKLKEYDGIAFGFPTRYGRTPAQVSALFDRTGGLWASGGLVGKFATVFTSTASQHGGQETTALTTYPFFVHHGMNIVPIGFANPDLVALDEVVGGSAYGAATIAGGDGSRQPSEKELGIAKFQGEHFGKIVSQFVRGQSA